MTYHGMTVIAVLSGGLFNLAIGVHSGWQALTRGVMGGAITLLVFLTYLRWELRRKGHLRGK